MINFVFWNVKQQADIPVITNLARLTDANILILAECDKNPSDILKALNYNSAYLYFYSPNINCEKIMIFSTFKSDVFRNVGDNERLSSRRLKHPIHGDILVVACHLISKSNASESMQHSQSILTNQFIESIENQEALNRTIVIGDMNMSPFDLGMVVAEGFHALPHLSVVKKEKRKIQGKFHNMFYNPMWRYLLMTC